MGFPFDAQDDGLGRCHRLKHLGGDRGLEDLALAKGYEARIGGGEPLGDLRARQLAQNANVRQSQLLDPSHDLLPVRAFANQDEDNVGVYAQTAGGGEHGLQIVCHAKRSGIQDDEPIPQGGAIPQARSLFLGDGGVGCERKVLRHAVHDDGDLFGRHAGSDELAPLPRSVQHDVVCVAVKEIGYTIECAIKQRAARRLPHRLE